MAYPNIESFTLQRQFKLIYFRFGTHVTVYPNTQIMGANLLTKTYCGGYYVYGKTVNGIRYVTICQRGYTNWYRIISLRKKIAQWKDHQNSPAILKKLIK